jgi:hypothetical protein
MKRNSIFSFALAILLAFSFSACEEKGKATAEAQQAADNFKAEPGQGTPIHFAHLKTDFKTVTAGEVVKAKYPFKNMTNLPVAIADIRTSCPCITGEFPKGNIQPGQVGDILVTFDTKGQFGDHYKLISVILQGSNEPITLELNGRIMQAAQ